MIYKLPKKHLDYVGINRKHTMTKSRKDIKGAGCKKVVIIGDDGIGKTSLLYRMIEKKQLESSIDLLSSFTHTTKVVVRTKSRKKINLDLWDTLSTEEYDRLRPLTYPKIIVRNSYFGLKMLKRCFIKNNFYTNAK